MNQYEGDMNKMMLQNAIAAPSLSEKAKDYFALLKFRLSALVVFSGVCGYLLGNGATIEWAALLALIAGSLMVTGAANIINQVLEKEHDKLMRRTMNRPLPTGRMSVQEAIVFAMVLAFGGLLLLATLVNILTACLSLLSLILYGFVYTPLKQLSPISVLVGAFPGAFPPLIGWAAATGTVGVEALILFGIQFIWQFPHFWAIAWIGDEDYKRAGFKMLPFYGKKDFNTALLITVYTTFLIPMGLLPYFAGMSGPVSAGIAVSSGILFVWQTMSLLKRCDNKAALQIMFASFFYLPIVQIALVIDRF